MHYVVNQPAHIMSRRNTNSKYTDQKCFPMEPGANIELISLHQFDPTSASNATQLLQCYKEVFLGLPKRKTKTDSSN